MSRVKEGTTQKIQRQNPEQAANRLGEVKGAGKGKEGGAGEGVGGVSAWQEDRELGGRCLQSFGSRVEMSDFVPSVCGSH